MSLATSLVYANSLYGGLRHRRAFDDLETFCMFVGYPRSGHSLVGSLLDAHPNVVISHELDVLRYVGKGFRRNQIYSLILDNARAFARDGRTWSGYRYTVPNQWQGAFHKLRVIGDKKGGKTTLRLRSDPGLLDRLRLLVGVGVKLIHIVRNPFDNISTVCKRNRRPLPVVVERYFSGCQVVRDVRSRVDKADFIGLRHEDLIQDPTRCLRALCRRLGVEASEEYANACADIVFSSPHKSRHEVSWDRGLIRFVEEKITSYDFLAGYSYKS